MRYRSQMAHYTVLALYACGVAEDPQLSAAVAQQTHGRVSIILGPALAAGSMLNAALVQEAVRQRRPDAVVCLLGAQPLIGSPPIRQWLGPDLRSLPVEVIRGNTATVAHRIALWLTPHAPVPVREPTPLPTPAPVEPEWLHPEVEAAAQQLCNLIKVHEPWLRRLVVTQDGAADERRIAVDRVPSYARFRGAPARSAEVGEHTRDLRGPSQSKILKILP